MSQIDTLQCLTKQQLPQAIAMISRAFHKDPLSIYVYPEGAEGISRLPLLFSIPLRYCSRYGEITITPEITGTACWLPPGRTTMHMGQMLLTGTLTSIFKMGSSGLKRLAIVDDYTRNMHQRCITEPHWYLMVLGVDPTRQGQGIGSKLLSAGVERADTSGLPCYLETMNPNNVPLYQKFGFAVANEGDIPESNVHVWGMVRPAHVHL